MIIDIVYWTLLKYYKWKTGSSLLFWSRIGYIFEIKLIYFNEDLTCNSKLEWHLSEITAAFLGISENKEKENKLEKHLLNSLKDFLSNTRMFKEEKLLIILST